MALNFSPDTETPTVVVPVSGTSIWVTAILGPTVSDLVSKETVAQTPEQVYTNGRSAIDRTDFNGTTLRARLVYYNDEVAYGDAPPLTIRVFGATGSDSWTVLRNLNGDASVAIPIDPPYTDHPGSDTRYTVAGGEASTSLVTQPDNNAHSWDCDGYDKFLIAIEQPFATDGENASSAYLQVRIV